MAERERVQPVPIRMSYCGSVSECGGHSFAGHTVFRPLGIKGRLWPTIEHSWSVNCIYTRLDLFFNISLSLSLSAMRKCLRSKRKARHTRERRRVECKPWRERERVHCRDGHCERKFRFAKPLPISIFTCEIHLTCMLIILSSLISCSTSSRRIV